MRPRVARGAPGAAPAEVFGASHASWTPSFRARRGGCASPGRVDRGALSAARGTCREILLGGGQSPGRAARCPPALLARGGWRPARGQLPRSARSARKAWARATALPLAGSARGLSLASAPRGSPLGLIGAVVSPQVAMDVEEGSNGGAGKNFLKMDKKR